MIPNPGFGFRKQFIVDELYDEDYEVKIALVSNFQFEDQANIFLQGLLFVHHHFVPAHDGTFFCKAGDGS